MHRIKILNPEDKDLNYVGSIYAYQVESTAKLYFYEAPEAEASELSAIEAHYLLNNILTEYDDLRFEIENI